MQQNQIILDATEELTDLLAVYEKKEAELSLILQEARDISDYYMDRYLTVRKGHQDVSEKLSNLKEKLNISEDEEDDE